MSDSVGPHRRQPTRLPTPWDSPGKNTGVGCHFLLQCMKVKSESEFAQSCPTLSYPVDCSLPGSSVHGIFQASLRNYLGQWLSNFFFLFVSVFFQNLKTLKSFMLIFTGLEVKTERKHLSIHLKIIRK